ncbi:MAG: NAD(P)-dependent oxidoreductase [Legionella sp.]|uniref:NAD(P)-dependent oxidoreductase n=1 Tax=Legionella sp. TaxID=459 RepID=UPI0039E2AA47
MNILADASLPGLAQAFPAPFQLTYYHQLDEMIHLLPGQEILLCRATLKVNKDLLKNHSLQYVITATSGTDHLDCKWLATENIQVINAKGCNARAVADYVVSCLAYLQLNNFVPGNRAGIIGFGHVGTQVAQRLKAAGFTLSIYDPPKALCKSGSFSSCQLEDLHQVDLLCIHAELHDQKPYATRNLIGKKFLTKLKPGCVIINAARGGIIDEEALINTSASLNYCTDVYLNEPKVKQEIIDTAILCTPHIAGHSLEAKYIAVAMVSKILHQLVGLPCPVFAKPKSNLIHLDPQRTWQENVLSIYNPLKETLVLKTAQDKVTTFLNLRKAHQQRHDFCLYAHAGLDKKTKLMLDK